MENEGLTNRVMSANHPCFTSYSSGELTFFQLYFYDSYFHFRTRLKLLPPFKQHHVTKFDSDFKLANTASSLLKEMT